MEGKQLDFNAPLLSVRRFAAAPPPAPTSSSSPANANANANAAAVVNSRAEVGGGGRTAGERPRRAPLPFYKSELKSGPVRNPGVVPFVWEQSPGRPKDGCFPGDSPARPVVAPKPPPGRVARRPPDEREEPIGTEASKSASNGRPPRRASPISSSTSTHTSTTTTTTTTTTMTTTSTSSFAANGTLSKRLESSREEPKEKVRTKPVVKPAAEAPISKEQRSSSQEEEEEEEEDAFSDALDTLSRTESFFMNCSISGMSGGIEAPEPSARFFTDPQARDFMMGRFLPAAQAMATGPLQGASRRTAAVPGREPSRWALASGGELRRSAVPLPNQQRPNLASSYPRITHPLDGGNGEGVEEDDDDDDFDDVGRLPMKGCGLLPRFCVRSSLCLLNPVPGMKVRGRMPSPAGRRPSPQVKTSHNGSVGDAEDEHTWEEVYKHKLRREHQPLGEERSKFISESNQLPYWSDSQTADGSSPYRRSNVGSVSPYRNDMPLSPFHEGKGFLGVPKCENRTAEDYAAFESCAKDDGGYWEITPSLKGESPSGSQSPVIEKTVYVDSVQVLDKTDLGSHSSDAKGTMNYADRMSETGGESQIIETSPILGICKDSSLQCKVSEVVDADELCSVDQLGPLEQMNNTVDSRQNHAPDGPQPLKADDQGKSDNSSLQSLLPPPLPKSPSESWLWRTLPSISSKNLTSQSFLGFQFHPKKQATQASSADPKWEAMVKTCVLRKGQVGFANALSKPANVD